MVTTTGSHSVQSTDRNAIKAKNMFKQVMEIDRSSGIARHEITSMDGRGVLFRGPFYLEKEVPRAERRTGRQTVGQLRAALEEKTMKTLVQPKVSVSLLPRDPSDESSEAVSKPRESVPTQGTEHVPEYDANTTSRHPAM